MRSKINLPIDEVIKDYQSGMSLKEMSDWYGVSDTTIRTRLKEAGVQILSLLERNNINLPMGEIIKGYQSGMSYNELGEKYGASAYIIKTQLKEAGVQIISAKERNKLKFPLEQVIKDYQSGMTSTELGEKYGFCADTIRTQLKEAGVQIISAKERNKLKFPLEQVIKDYQSGMTSTELGKKYGYDAKTITTRLREAGVQIRKRGFGGMNKAKKEKLYDKQKISVLKRNKKKYPLDKIKKDYESGMTSYELGKKYGCSYATILKRLREAGVQIQIRKRNTKKKGV